MMSRRLLDSDIEQLNFMSADKYLVKQIKSSLGSEFSKSLEIMINEVDQSYQNRKDFEAYQKNSGASVENSTISATVLAKSDWVSSTQVELKPPLDVLGLQKQFESFFLSRTGNSSKSVAWVYTYGSMEVRVNLGVSKWYNLHCKPYHYFVLALLENNGEMSF